ncbi:MAG: hypothetical protein MK135_15125, partial [Polyangiaceae bacterium]|nr:hypothetical protein [Polyangiaceae bacterium]
LNSRRQRSARNLERAAQKEKLLREAERQAQLRQAAAITADVGSLILTQGGYLLGPVVGFEWNQGFPLRLRTQFSWMTGGLNFLDAETLGQQVPRFSLWDLRWQLSWAFSLAPKIRGDVGLLAAVGALQFPVDVLVDGQAGQQVSWTARAAGVFVGEYALSELMRARFGVEVGALLRPVPLLINQQEERLQGMSVALSLGFAFSAGALH